MNKAQNRRPALYVLIPIPFKLLEVETLVPIRAGGTSMMNSPKYSTAEIRAVWEKEGKQRWDGQTHGRGLGLLMVHLVAQGTLMLGRLRQPSRTFEFWRDQNKIRGRLIGLGNGVVVARLNKDGLPE